MGAALSVAKSELIIIALTLLVLMPLELLAPREKQPLVSRLRGITFGLCFIPFVMTTIMFFRWLWPTLGVSFFPLFTIPAAMPWLGPVAAITSPIVAAIVVDFFFYWGHRAQHRFFWRFHSVHHSIRELNGINAYHHFTEQVFRLTIFAIPASLVAVETSPAVPALAVVIILWPAYLHSPTAFHLGPFASVMVDNRFHRIHHSLEPGHFDKNFGAFTTLWDWMFRTAYWPNKGEWPAVGIDGVEEPATIRDWLTLPWRRKASPEPLQLNPRVSA